jgi:hypothetical protein
VNKYLDQNNSKRKSAAKKKVKRSAAKNDKYSQDGNAALSFKSMTSYIMGDLDLSGEDKEVEEESEFASSFEISSNSSNKISGASMVRSNSLSGRNANVKLFKEDRKSDVEKQDGYLRDDQFQGFISKQSPFSFKNPIFFSCPNNKQGVQRAPLNTQDLQSRRQLFADQAVTSF